MAIAFGTSSAFANGTEHHVEMPPTLAGPRATEGEPWHVSFDADGSARTGGQSLAWE